MQGVGNTIKIVFFCLYSKATPFKIPSRGVILHLTPFPLFITLHFSSLCEEGKVRKLEERLDCVCVRNKEDVASNTIREGAQGGSVSRQQCVCVSLCMCVYINHCRYRHTQSVQSVSYYAFPQSDLVYHPCS